MTTADKKGSTGTSAKDNQSNAGVSMEVETTRRLKMLGFEFTETSVNGKGGITLSGPGQKDHALDDDEISAFVRFFVGFQRRQERDDGGADTQADGRGQVNSETDGRLKENRSGK